MSLRSFGKSCAASSCIFFSIFARSSGVNGSSRTKFVEKSGVDGRADAELDVREKAPSPRRRASALPNDETRERVGIFFGEDLELDVVIERAAQID